MTLMLTLDDAAKVCAELIRTYADCELYEEDIEGIRQDLEQKCYFCDDDHDHFKELSDLIMDINPAEIVDHIKEDNLKDWCGSIQVAMNMELIQLKRSPSNSGASAEQAEKQDDEEGGKDAGTDTHKESADYGKIDMDVIPRSNTADRRQDLRNNGGTHLICFATRKNVR